MLTRYFCLYLFVFLASMTLAQKRNFDFRKIQSGPYFGLQQGKNWVVELGYERRMKEIKFKNPTSNAFFLGANYDINTLVLGSDLGFWFRPSRIGFTWGGQLAFRTDFEDSKIGFSPTIGYKIWFLHANVGYYFYTSPKTTIPTNQLFLNLRLVLSEKTKFKRN